jgi:hypothetical protein
MVQIELSAEELEMIRAMRQRAKASPGSSLDPAVSPIHHTSNPSSPVTSPEIDKAGQSTIASSSSDSDFLSAEVFQELQIPQPDSVRPGYHKTTLNFVNAQGMLGACSFLRTVLQKLLGPIPFGLP